MQIFSDFDGTITLDDATDIVLSNLADPSWQLIEESWKQGIIGSGECMRQQIKLINAPKFWLNEVLDSIKIDTDFPSFVQFCRSHSIPLMIVSDGVDYFIHRILSRHGITGLPIRANHLKITSGGYCLESPYAIQSCDSLSGVCKCRITAPQDKFRIYIGDGRSDFCAVTKKPELVFAKNSLAKFCRTEEIPFVNFKTFADIRKDLEARPTLTQTNLAAA